MARYGAGESRCRVRREEDLKLKPYKKAVFVRCRAGGADGSDGVLSLVQFSSVQFTCWGFWRFWLFHFSFLFDKVLLNCKYDMRTLIPDSVVTCMLPRSGGGSVPPPDCAHIAWLIAASHSHLSSLKAASASTV